jgi:hypothetical protein
MNDDGCRPPSGTVTLARSGVSSYQFLVGEACPSKNTLIHPPVAGFNRVSDLGAGRMGIARDYSSLFVIITRCLGADDVVNFRHGRNR